MPTSSKSTITDVPVAPREGAPPFSIGHVESTEPLAEGAGKFWCKYTIVQGANTITGYRQGGVKAVKLAVGEIVADMNQRRMGKRGRVHLTPSGKPKANAPVVGAKVKVAGAKAK